LETVVLRPRRKMSQRREDSSPHLLLRRRSQRVIRSHLVASLALLLQETRSQLQLATKKEASSVPSLLLAGFSAIANHKR